MVKKIDTVDTTKDDGHLWCHEWLSPIPSSSYFISMHNRFLNQIVLYNLKFNLARPLHLGEAEHILTMIHQLLRELPRFGLIMNVFVVTPLSSYLIILLF